MEDKVIEHTLHGTHTHTHNIVVVCTHTLFNCWLKYMYFSVVDFVEASILVGYSTLLSFLVIIRCSITSNGLHSSCIKWWYHTARRETVTQSEENPGSNGQDWVSFSISLIIIISIISPIGISLHIGWVLKRYPWVRLLLFVYIVSIIILRLW